MAAMATIWDFLSERFELFLIYKSPWCFLPSFESIGFSVQKKKWKIDFQDGRHLGIPTGIILAIFDLQVILMLPTNFKIKWPFGSGEEVKKRVSRWPPWRPSWISNPNNLSYFKSTSHSNASYQVSSQLAFQSWRSEKFIFKMAVMAAILDFQKGWLQLFLIYRSPQCFLPSLKLISLSVQEKKRKNIFSRWPPWRPSWISNLKDFSRFWSIIQPDASYQVSSQLAFRFRRRSKK